MIQLAYAGALLVLILITIWASRTAARDQIARTNPAEHKHLAKVYAFRAQSYRMQSEVHQQSARQLWSTAASSSKQAAEERRNSEFLSTHYLNRAAKMRSLEQQHSQSAHEASADSRKAPGPRLVINH